MKLASYFILVIAFVIAASTLSVNIWSEKPEEISAGSELQYRPNMTLGEFAEVNNLQKSVVKNLFSLTSPSELQKRLSDFDISKEELQKKIHGSMALEEEAASKNWVKIPLKFGLWFVFLAAVFFAALKRKINRKTRLILYGVSFTLFGVILGADPSPMGTVKDAIVLYGSKGVVFLPRMAAFCVFTVLVILANKFICSWGCQFGTLQDFIFRLNRNDKDTKGVLPQIKVPFVISNSVRFIFLIALTAAAFKYGYDLTHEIDPFKIFKPMKITLIGWVFMSVLLVSSLFVYRPWCHFLCPFGFTGWLFEKISIFRIKVDYDACIACKACEKACPSDVMSAILKRDKMTVPDCFSCSSCINVCPADAVRMGAGRRALPPEGKFSE
jgi:NAD-dependent dihydropyrimidine dehydrogenase PreA subunit